MNFEKQNANEFDIKNRRRIGKARKKADKIRAKKTVSLEVNDPYNKSGVHNTGVKIVEFGYCFIVRLQHINTKDLYWLFEVCRSIGDFLPIWVPFLIKRAYKEILGISNAHCITRTLLGNI